MDGPFAETKEQLLGFWIIDCASLEDAIETARRFASHKQTGAIEIRPVAPRDQGTACRRFEETQRIPLVDLPLEDFIFSITARRETL